MQHLKQPPQLTTNKYKSATTVGPRQMPGGHKNKIMMIMLSFIFITSNALASDAKLFSFLPKRPFYFGFGMGLGTTFWQQFTAKTSPFEDPADPTASARVSVPAHATGYGLAKQVLAGLYLSKHFALQFDYEILPTTHVEMKGAIMYLDNLPNPDFSFNSTSYRYDIMAKYLVSIMHSSTHFYVDLGPNWTERDDPYTHKNRYTGAVFGLGFNTVFENFLQLDLSYQYSTGAGKASVVPLYDYMPFTGSLLLSTSLRF